MRACTERKFKVLCLNLAHNVRTENLKFFCHKAECRISFTVRLKAVNKIQQVRCHIAVRKFCINRKNFLIRLLRKFNCA